MYLDNWPYFILSILSVYKVAIYINLLLPPPQMLAWQLTLNSPSAFEHKQILSPGSLRNCVTKEVSKTPETPTLLVSQANQYWWGSRHKDHEHCFGPCKWLYYNNKENLSVATSKFALCEAQVQVNMHDRYKWMQINMSFFGPNLSGNVFISKAE